MITAERFAELYHEHWSSVYGVCKTRLGDEEESLDAAMEVFFRKWRAIDSYDPARATFRTWLWRNAERMCIEVLRKRSRHGEVPLCEETMGTETPASDLSPLMAQVTLCLSALNAVDRQLLLMHEVEGYTWEEMAELTELSVWQVRDRVAKTIEQLRKTL